MQFTLPEPQDAGVKIPKHLMKDRFCAGFLHALEGGQMRKLKHFRLSFREGYRAGKLYLREVRRSRGILTFPVQGRMKLKTVT